MRRLINKNNSKISPLLLLALSCFFLNACSNESISPEDEIKQYIATGKLAAENRNHNDLANLISDQYKDQRNWDKKKIQNIARAYFFTHKNIHLFTKIDSIDFQDKNHAFVVIHVAMAGTAISDLNAISQLRARIYQFDLQLVKNKKWLLQQAKWKRAQLKDML